MKIYTKTGDTGKTALFGGRRVIKDDVRIEAYGTVDELNASIGLANTSVEDDGLQDILSEIQHQLFVLGADLATPLDIENVQLKRIESGHITRMEENIDRIEARLEAIRYFILPGGSEASSRLHVSRTICRRAERHIVHLAAAENINELDIQYINRLSDFLFVLARYANHLAGQADLEWRQD